ncbi:MAG: MBOAT family protein [Oscillospiraceae bacterium]|jgi:alginate O-acetyltransferase complex protein AlgI|nr:MBOAT family protein [Oscillospiraceae bacterium]
MLFSSPTFLFYFLPITLIVYFLTPMLKKRGADAEWRSPRIRNLVLLAVSLVFYAWGEPRYVFLMAAQCASAWGFGLLIDRYRGKKAAKAWMIASVAVSLSGLIFFKYANFFIGNINGLFGGDIPLIGLLMPIGISFYTFQIVSYTFDLYRGQTEVQRSVFDFSTYVALFPQLIAGPIVRYADVALEIGRREHTVSRFSMGARRFVIGLGKKMLLANVFGELVDIYKRSGEKSVLFVWLYLFAYSLQIYFDFSGYSDMAIGLGHIFGFKFLENFNYPYIADSITDFWRRWHMSLSSWFRDYVYIPLGGNRVSARRHIFNIFVVWALTGFWHGADWNFIIWGVFFGVMLTVEKFFLIKALGKAPRALRHIYVILIVFISWSFFDATGGAGTIATALGRMFGVGADALAGREALYYLKSYALPLAVGIIGVTPLPKKLAEKVLTRKTLGSVLEPLAVAALLVTATAAMIDGSFNPFIYFRF